MKACYHWFDLSPPVSYLHILSIKWLCYFITLLQSWREQKLWLLDWANLAVFMDSTSGFTLKIKHYRLIVFILYVCKYQGIRCLCTVLLDYLLVQFYSVFCTNTWNIMLYFHLFSVSIHFFLCLAQNTGSWTDLGTNPKIS